MSLESTRASVSPWIAHRFLVAALGLLAAAAVVVGVGLASFVIRQGTGSPAPGAGDASDVPITMGVSTSPSVSALSNWHLTSPWFSPDGSKFFALRHGDGLVVGAADGTGVRVVETRAVAACWGPDSNTLAIVSMEGQAWSPGQAVPVYWMSTDGSLKRRLGLADSPRVTCLPDGRVAFGLGQALHLADPGTGLDTIVQGVSLEPPSDAMTASGEPYAVSPDGSHVALLRGTTLTMVDTRNGATKDLTSAVDARRWGPYSWSPDGAQLAYADMTPDGVPRIVIYDQLSGSQRVLVEGDQRGTFAGPAWTPDGRWLLYAFYPAGTEAESESAYWATDVSSGERVSLFTGGIGLRLSPDGRRITFARTVGDRDQLGYWVAELRLNP